MRKTLLALVVALAALVGVCGPASAHDVLISTDPADGSTISRMPAAIKLTFNLPALDIGTAVQVNGPGGDIAAGKASLVDDTVTQPVAAGAPAGAYTVVWRITSADGHPISGTFAFTARGSSTTSSSSASPSASSSSSPSSAAPSTSAAAPVAQAAGSNSEASGSPSPWVWVVLGLVVVLVLAGVLLVIRRGDNP